MASSGRTRCILAIAFGAIVSHAPACGGDAIGGSGTGGAATGGAATGGTAGTDVMCQTASDCSWGEIDHEIRTSSDCICLFGCPSLPLRKDTVDRRQAQYLALCDPRVDGQGNLCPIDDCAAPPAPTCDNGICGPADPYP